MIIKFYNQPEVIVSNEVGEKIMAELAKPESERQKYVKIDGEMYSLANMSAVTKGGYIEPDIKKVEEVFGTLPAGPTCRGQYSIHKELIRIALSEKGGARKLKDKAWREETLEKLRASTDKWCDNKKGTCFCEDDFRPEGSFREQTGYAG